MGTRPDLWMAEQNQATRSTESVQNDGKFDQFYDNWENLNTDIKYVLVKAWEKGQ